MENFIACFLVIQTRIRIWLPDSLFFGFSYPRTQTQVTAHGQFLSFSEQVLLCAVLSFSNYVPFSWNFEKCLELDTLEIPPLSQRVFEVAVSGSRQTKQFSTFQAGGSPGVCPECHTSYVHPHNMENVSSSTHFAEIP